MKSVQISDEQNQWFKDNAINFSAWVRIKIEEEIQKSEVE